MCTMEINACMQWALCLSKREQVANLGSRRSSQTCGSTPWLHQCIHLRFRHTLGKVLQPFAAKLNVVWSLPVDRPVSIRASGNEPSLEAQDARSIGQSATTAHCLLARQSVAPIAILPADSSPTCLTGSRDDWSYLEGSAWKWLGTVSAAWRLDLEAQMRCLSQGLRAYSGFHPPLLHLLWENQNPMPTLHLRCLAQLMRPAASDLSSACLGSFVFVFW